MAVPEQRDVLGRRLRIRREEVRLEVDQRFAARRLNGEFGLRPRESPESGQHHLGRDRAKAGQVTRAEAGATDDLPGSPSCDRATQNLVNEGTRRIGTRRRRPRALLVADPTSTPEPNSVPVPVCLGGGVEGLDLVGRPSCTAGFDFGAGIRLHRSLRIAACGVQARLQQLHASSADSKTRTEARLHCVPKSVNSRPATSHLTSCFKMTRDSSLARRQVVRHRPSVDCSDTRSACATIRTTEFGSVLRLADAVLMDFNVPSVGLARIHPWRRSPRSVGEARRTAHSSW